MGQYWQEMAKVLRAQMVGGKLYAGPPERTLLGEMRGGQFYLTTAGEDVVKMLAEKATAKAIADTDQPAEKPRRGRPPKSALPFGGKGDHDNDGRPGGDAAKHHALSFAEDIDTKESTG